MLEGLLTLPVIVPVLFWGAYHYYKDRHLPEPPGNLILCLLLGIGASYLSAGLYEALGSLGLRYDAVSLANSNATGLLLYALLVIGPVEEVAKMLPFVIIVLRFRAFDEPLDGMIYASFVALGYAAAENVHYLQFLTPLEAVARGFAGPVVHMLFASIWGHWIGMAYLEKRPIWRPMLVSFAIAAGLHGLYDFIVLLRPTNALPVAAVLIAVIWLARLKLMQMLQVDALAASTEKKASSGTHRQGP